MITTNILSNNDLMNLRMFAFWGSIMVLKILAMFPLTARLRFSKRIFISPEDTMILKGSKVVRDDEDIERVRRAHLNDLENILPWAISTALWLTTSPHHTTATVLISVFCVARIIHTFVYAVFVIPQPTRAIAFGVGAAITFYQSVMTIYHYI